MTLRCVFVGSGQQLIACAEQWLAKGNTLFGIISDCPEVSAWCQVKGTARISQRETETAEQVRWLSREPYDYLFSVVNHAILSADMLATAKRAALNYHDSPLPEYAGFNATTWAILEGRTTHAVTWHEMTASVDAGQIVIQQALEIREDDTAFTLGVKCAEAGVRTFGSLIALLEASARTGSALARTPQAASKSFHHRSERPGLGLLDWQRSAGEISALVRGLNLGPHDSWLCKPKLQLPNGRFVTVTTARVVERTLETSGSPRAPGTVLSIGEHELEILTGDGVLALSDFTTLDGAELAVSELCAEYALSEGSRLPALSEPERIAVREYDKSITSHERFWVERLRSSRAPTLFEPKPRGAETRSAALARTLTGELAALARMEPERRHSAFVAALALYLARVGDGEGFDLALHRPPALPAGVAAAYAVSTPLRCAVDLGASFASLLEATRSELGTLAKRRTFARDLVLRYRVLRGRPLTALPIGVQLDGELTPALLEGTQLNLIVGASGLQYAWVYDEASIGAEAVASLAARFEVLLAAGLRDATKPLAELEILPEAERARLLTTWQDTKAAYATNMCVHQLFEQQVQKSPDATAVVFRDQSLSYRELNQRANHAAGMLRAAGVQPETLVGICVERSLDMMVGLLGILKAGGAYVPLDPVYPRERLAMMLEDAHARVLVTQRHLVDRLPAHGAEVLCIDELPVSADSALENPSSGVQPDNLAYVIFTSGSTGRPKGVMVQHRNVVNFCTGMDARIGAEPGVWLAVTSISFDISVLELFWTLARGFEVVIQEESDRASLSDVRAASSARSRMDFGLFYFAADGVGTQAGNAYKLLLEGAKFADTHDFSAVWTPERHFHAFGGLYPNPAVTTAALATITQRVALRAGSVVLPLHNPLRVAEDWAVIDQLSGGRVGLSFASGWHVNDFAFMPENYARRREIMLEHIETVLKLWRGEKVSVKNGQGESIEVSVLPRPVQKRPPIWIASAGSVDTFKLAGKLGVNVLTNMLGQDLADLKNKLAAYRAARIEHGHDGPGYVSIMLHTFVCGSTEEAKRLARKPFCDYLASSFDLVKVAPWMFPAFRQPSKDAAHDAGIDASAFTAQDMEALLEHAFDRYFDTAGLFGTPERAMAMVEQLKAIGANEVACLIDFGIDPDVVLQSLPHLDRLRQLANANSNTSESESGFSIGEQLRARKVTHLQCTPSMARMLASDPETLHSLRGIKRLMLGGEALPSDLAQTLLPAVGGEILNMYGPTETTIWSTTARVEHAGRITIGRPIANTIIRIVDARRQLVPVGTPGELCIGGAGVVRGYLERHDLTAERFIQDPFGDAQSLLYRTGDLARYRADGEIEFLGRLDHQVKVNGYRIELAEIETVLSRHPLVRQSVVVARSDDGPVQLVAYLVCAGRESATGTDKDRVAHWQSLWDETYKRSEPTDELDPRFNITGWNNSYSGEPIAHAEMSEWLGATVQRILALEPKRVLEIGCGTGMLLYRVAPHVAHYTAVDLSPHALETIRRELSETESAKVTLLQQAAHTLEGVAEQAFDTVVINSVAQYFPDADYLVRVLRRASELVVDRGRIFIGDVRSLEHLQAFHTWVELQQAPAHLSAAELVQRVERRVAQDSELVLSPAFFHALTREIPRIVAVDIRLKPGLAHNEMNCFRYDVTLHIGVVPLGLDVSPASPVSKRLETLADIGRQLASEPPLLALPNLVNARLSPVVAAHNDAAQQPALTVEQLRQHLTTTAQGIDPGALVKLDARYDVELVWSAGADERRFDALLRHKQRGPKGRWTLPTPASPAAAVSYANAPAKVSDTSALFGQLRTHLREFLPEYMLPAAFVLLDTFPLTPNGKIDRKALPAPQRQERRSADEYLPPSNELEQIIGEVWQRLLNLERVGRRDNIFDLGANSLLTVQANNSLSAKLERRVPLVSMFRFPTIEALAAHLGQRAEPQAEAEKRSQRSDRKADAAARRRALREERGSR